MLLDLVSMTVSIAIFDGDDNRFLVHVHADIVDVVTHLSYLFWGKVIRARAYLPLRKSASPRPLCLPSPREHPRLSSAAVAKRSPAQRSAAEPAPHPRSIF